VAVNEDGQYITATSVHKLDKKIEKYGWFSPYYEQVGIPVPDAIARPANGSLVDVRRRGVGRIAYGNAEPNLTTSISGEMRNSSAQTRAKRFTDSFVDDGATRSSIKQSDVTKQTRQGRPIPTIHGYGGVKHSNVPTYLKFITIDNLQTRCECTVDERAIGLDVIHRYVHVIDYRNAQPRTWTARPDLHDQATESSSSASSDESDTSG
jgi:hypothetical protein